MWIKSSGQITENVYQLTTAVSSHFLIFGDAGALVDAGIAVQYERLESELATYFTDGESLTYLLVTHAHFDHVGGIPQLKQKFPDLEIVASPTTAELFKDAAHVKSIYEANKVCAASFKQELAMSEKEFAAGLVVDHIVGDGDTIELGSGVDVKVIGCPGHTEDCTAYFVRPDGALQGGEAVGGYHGRELYASCFTSSYQSYVDTLDKLASLEINAIGLPHAGALSGELAKRYLLEARQEADKFFQQIKERLDQGELVDDICASLLPEWRSEGRVPEGPFASALEQTLASMVSVVAAT